jgi:formylglycine-generating enzyme required for sulfatase activity
MHRRLFVKTLSAACGIGCSAASAEESFDFRPALIRAPLDPLKWDVFRAELNRWRDETRQRLRYDGSLYSRADFAWAPSSYACCMIMLWDQDFFDLASGKYRVAEWLAHGRREFGGYDSVVFWHAYPRIGLDNRNQYDFYRQAPGGLRGLRAVTREFRQEGVRTYLDYNPWDLGTRREPQSDLDVLARLVGDIEADGIFLDTMSTGASEFRAKLDAVRPGVVLEGEAALPLENLHDHHMSWAQAFQDSWVPGILRDKWIERRHMMHQINRWDRDHTPELHTAWMNGSGMLVWENVFGVWVGWSERDRSLLRSMLPIQRRYQKLFSGERWTPLVPALAPDVFASLWEADGLRLWTVVNRSQQPVEGALIRVPGNRPGAYFELSRGEEATASRQGGDVVLSGRMGPRGLAAFACGEPAAFGEGFPEFLRAQRQNATRTNDDLAFPARLTTYRAPAEARQSGRLPLDGMAEIAPVRFRFTVSMRVRENGFYEAQSDIDMWSSYEYHVVTFQRTVALGRYAIDLTPVTNAQYARFLVETSYRPKYTENLLKHWIGGSPPADKEGHPVVYVDLDDARAYAKWAGKRLPTEEEWQYAAQGDDGRSYPWGDKWQSGLCNEGLTGETTNVTAFPGGRSPFGCWDMCGNVWEWTESERSDGRNRFCMIRGGSFYEAKGSNWYMNGGPQHVDFAAKFMLFWPGLDRCATVGFRCVSDL